MMGMFFFLTQFLQDVLHYSAIVTGLAFLPLTIVLFAASQFSARVLTSRVSAKIVMAVGLSFSTVGLLWMTELNASSVYLNLLGPLVLFGIGNGLAFVPLTTTALRGVAPADAGAASGLVNVFGSASRAAVAPAGSSPLEKVQHAFVVGADRGFLVAACFLAATVVLVLVAIRPQPKPAPVSQMEDLDAEAAELDASVSHA